MSAVYRAGCFLLRRHHLVSRPVRLIGLGVSTLSDGSARQLSFWADKY